MRARIRSPRCSCSRCLGVYATAVRLGGAGTHVLFLLLVLVIPLLQSRFGGIAVWPLRRCRQTSGFHDQSADLENRALSPGRAFINEIGLEAISFRHSLLEMTPEGTSMTPEGCTGKRFWRKLQM